jgi:hypothetical protein
VGSNCEAPGPKFQLYVADPEAPVVLSVNVTLDPEQTFVLVTVKSAVTCDHPSTVNSINAMTVRNILKKRFLLLFNIMVSETGFISEVLTSI